MQAHLPRTGQCAGAGSGPRSGSPVPSGGRDTAFHTVRLIDLPQYDTDSAAIDKRLREFLTGLRERRLLLAYFNELRKREQIFAPAPVLPLDWPGLQKLRGKARMRRFVSLPYRDQLHIKRRADALAARRRKASGLGNLKEHERERLKPLLGEVPAAVMPSEHRADKMYASGEGRRVCCSVNLGPLCR